MTNEEAIHILTVHQTTLNDDTDVFSAKMQKVIAKDDEAFRMAIIALLRRCRYRTMRIAVSDISGKARENMNSQITLARCPICGKFYPADKIHKCRKRLEVDCRKCENCTVKSCKVYGDDADIAVRSCAQDEFKNYKERES